MIIAGINYKWQADCHTGLSIVFLTTLSPRLIRNWHSVNSRAVLFSSDRHLQIISFGEVQKLCSKPLAILEQRTIWEAVSYHFPPLETSQQRGTMRGGCIRRLLDQVGIKLVHCSSKLTSEEHRVAFLLPLRTTYW